MYLTSSLLSLIKEIVECSHNFPRPENTMARSDKMFIWNVGLEDETVNDVHDEIKEIIDNNMEYI
jgi:hypothetical protein